MKIQWIEFIFNTAKRILMKDVHSAHKTQYKLTSKLYKLLLLIYDFILFYVMFHIFA